jgi:hypothetical protein
VALWQDGEGMTNANGTGKALRAPRELDERGAAALRLADRYAGDLPDRLQLETIRATAEDLDSLEAALLYAARRPGASTGGKPLLTFRQIAAAIGAESEQAAQGRYRRKVGNPSSSESGNDGIP